MQVDKDDEWWMYHDVKDGSKTGLMRLLFFFGGRKGMTGLDELKMDDGLVMDQRKPLGPAALLVWSELPTWRGCGGALNWRVSDALAPVKKEKNCRPPPNK